MVQNIFILEKIKTLKINFILSVDVKTEQTRTGDSILKKLKIAKREPKRIVEQMCCMDNYLCYMTSTSTASCKTISLLFFILNLVAIF